MNHTILHRDGGTVTVNNYIRSKAIKLWCTECMGWESNPNTCDQVKCPLFPFKGRRLDGITKKKEKQLCPI